jgi:hypothetical protein
MKKNTEPISSEKCASFVSFMNNYRQKNYLSHSDLFHIISLTSYNFNNNNHGVKGVDATNFNSAYDAWQKNHEVEIDVKTDDNKPIIQIDFSLNSLSDLISIVDKFPLKTDSKYNIDLKLLNAICPELKELNAMVGISNLKCAIMDQLLYYLQGFHLHGSADDYKHIVLYGPPGSGKTEIAKIIGRMYSKMGVIKKPKPSSTESDKKTGVTAFKKITRTDLVAGYLGQTAIKTKAVINECLGGVIFLDEAYSLGHKEGSDSFSKECADTLCEALSDNRDNLMFIIAGYEKELENNFFALNQGLESRFVWRFKIDNYTHKDLWQIFQLKVSILGVSQKTIVEGWTMDADLIKNGEDWFKKKHDSLSGLGRDVDTLLFKTKIAHSRRMYGKMPDVKCQIGMADLNAGYDMFMKSKSSTAEIDKRERKRIAESLYI